MKEKEKRIKLGNIKQHRIKVICCPECSSEEIERVIIGIREVPKCKRCNLIIE